MLRTSFTFLLPVVEVPVFCDADSKFLPFEDRAVEFEELSKEDKDA